MRVRDCRQSNNDDEGGGDDDTDDEGSDSGDVDVCDVDT